MGNETYSTISSYVEIQAVNLKGGPTENKKCIKLENQNKNDFISLQSLTEKEELITDSANPLI